MPLYAGVCEMNITPPPDVWMGGYAGRGRAVGIHDELHARALVVDNGERRVALITADLVALTSETAMPVRESIAQALGTVPAAIMLHCTHTHGGPGSYPYRGMGELDAAYVEVLQRKLIGVARQAADHLQPAHLTYGEASAQIGVNRRQKNAAGSVVIGKNYGGPVSPLVQVICLNGADGRTFALLFSHACHPTTVGRDNRQITADWPGAAAMRLRERFRTESAETGIAADAVPLFLQGCCGDINPLRQGTWEAIHTNGRIIADAAHTARWNAHGQLGETLGFAETTLQLPLLPPPPLDECERCIAEMSATMQRALCEKNDLAFMQAEGRLQWAQDARTIASAPTSTFINRSPSKNSV